MKQAVGNRACDTTQPASGAAPNPRSECNCQRVRSISAWSVLYLLMYLVSTTRGVHTDITASITHSKGNRKGKAKWKRRD